MDESSEERLGWSINYGSWKFRLTDLDATEDRARSVGF